MKLVIPPRGRFRLPCKRRIDVPHKEIQPAAFDSPERPIIGAIMKHYDFVIIGSGIAGLTFALKAAKHGSVVVITKRKGADSNTAWAQGGIACVMSDEDSSELHVRDTLEAGAGLCDEAAVRTIVSEAPARIRELVDLGLQFDERE